MRIAVCVDDTDDLTKKTSTGKICGMIGDLITKNGGSIQQGITRHQLLLSDEIKYTSHNSSFCFIADCKMPLTDFISQAEKILAEECAEVADPGLCIVELDKIADPSSLIDFGKRAKKEVIKKSEAYEFAKERDGIFLKEYGGNGIGVIGALAGVGLRLSGCDGSFRSQIQLDDYERMTAAEYKERFDVEQIVDFDSRQVPDDMMITLMCKAKLFLYDNKKTLVVRQIRGVHVFCNKNDVIDGDHNVFDWHTQCDMFSQDNDPSEMVGDEDRSCYNCLYRRWTAGGFDCVKGRLDNRRI